MPAKVFISYRRDDSRYQARMIHAAFCQAIEPDHVFMDIDSIPPGANFRKILKDWVDQCDVLLALIGRGWIDAAEQRTGERRLDNASDFVRIEIGEALARDIPVVPILLDGTLMPGPNQLPEDIKELADRQAEFVEFRTFDADVERLIRKLRLEKRSDQGAVATDLPPKDRNHTEGRLMIDANIIHGATDGWLLPGAGKTEWFQDLDVGPEMVVIPAGCFLMGSPEGEGDEDERPQHEVSIAKPFAVGRYAITFDEWDAALIEGGVTHNPETVWGRGQQPVMDVTWKDAKVYCDWLSQITGKTYRLLSEAEWEYVARAGTTTPFWWSREISTAQANFDGTIPYGTSNAGRYRAQTVPVRSFKANPWGLYQMHGNVWEWCEDNWHKSYARNPPTDGSTWPGGDTSQQVIRGGGWDNEAIDVRAAVRAPVRLDHLSNALGFRLARTLGS